MALPLLAGAARLGLGLGRAGASARVLAFALRSVLQALRPDPAVAVVVPRIELSAKVTGLDEIRRNLRRYSNKMRRKIVRAALAEGARLLRDTSRMRAPVLSLSIRGNVAALRRGVRKVGTVKKSIRVLSRKARDGGTLIRTSVAVAPSKTAPRGAKSPHDPFYWRFLEFGYQPRGPRGELRAPVRGRARPPQPQPARGFMRAGVAKLPEAAQLIVRRIQNETSDFDRNPTD